MTKDSEATPKPDSPTGYGEACDSCGRSYEITYRVPDDIWLKIAPRPEAIGDHPEHALGGLLCPDCASSRAKALGVTLRFNADTDWPDSPVCVESATLEWETFGADHHALPDEYVAETVLAHYRIIGPMADGKWHAGVNEPGNFSRHHFPEMDTLEAAQAACQADFTRRVLELVNARSVESVRAAALTEMRDDLAGVAACYGWSASQSADGPYVSLDDWITEQAAPLIDPLPNDFGEAVQQEWESQIREKARAQGAAEERERLLNDAEAQARAKPLGQAEVKAIHAAQWLRSNTGEG